MKFIASSLCVTALAASTTAIDAVAAAPPAPAFAGEVVAFRSKDGLAVEDNAARIAPFGSQPDVLLLPRASPSRNGPDAGAMLCYAVAASPTPGQPGSVVRGELSRFISVDQGRSWSGAEPVVINGWPKDLEGHTPAAPSAVQLPDDRIRLYFTISATDSRRPGPAPNPPQRIPPIRNGDSSQPQSSDEPDTAQPRSDRVYSAISNDGKTFAFEDGVRFELGGLSAPEVIRLPGPPTDDTRRIGPWLMFFTRDGSTLLATSRDGLAWTRDETFVWTSAHEAGAILTSETSREVRLYGCDRTGVVSVRFDPSTGDLHADPAIRWGPKHADPSAASCGDGAVLLVCVRESTDKPSGPRREPLPLPVPDRPVSPPTWPGSPK